MKFKRSSGVLLHPTSFPAPYGIGNLGAQAFRWIDWLAETGCTYWQILPLGPTGFGDSPYQCFSAFAGNPYLIDLELFLENGWLMQDDLVDTPSWDQEKVDFGRLCEWKPRMLSLACSRFLQQKKKPADFEKFILDNSYWLDDFVLFMTIKELSGGGPWSEWPEELRLAKKASLKKIRDGQTALNEKYAFHQYSFYKQWVALKRYANERGIRIIGDLPIFVAMDSSDVWSHPELFHLDANKVPTVVAGVPPDYFSPTGQLWGNPLYNWDEHKESNYFWWQERIRFSLQVLDVIRIDHFRGFAGYWEIPFNSPTAETGRWVKGPGEDFFNSIRSNLGDLPIIAEDLGEITPDVIELREQFSLPGMKILQFAFSGPDNPFLPHNHKQNSVVYTGTHDNDTTRGWYGNASDQEKQFAQRYFRRSWQNGGEFSWDLILTAWESVADLAIVPLQDLLCLDSQARFNYPSRLGGNWEWRMKENDLSEELKNKLREINWLYQR